MGRSIQLSFCAQPPNPFFLLFLNRYCWSQFQRVFSGKGILPCADLRLSFFVFLSIACTWNELSDLSLSLSLVMFWFSYDYDYHQMFVCFFCGGEKTNSQSFELIYFISKLFFFIILLHSLLSFIWLCSLLNRPLVHSLSVGLVFIIPNQTIPPTIE